MLAFHVTGGAIAIVTGLIALYALKGAALHRRSGTVFVFAMVVMSLSGATLALARGREPGNVVMGCLSAYLVVSGLLAVRRSDGRPKAVKIRRHLWRMCAALFVATGSFFLGPVRRIPEPLRIPALRLIPLIVLVTMVYWLWQYRRGRSSHGAVATRAAEVH